MVRHIVSWNFKEELTPEEKAGHGLKIKKDLEALKSVIEGIQELTVIVSPLPSSNAEIVLNSLFETEEALAAYQIHPEHKKASSFVGSVTKDRRCLDFLE